MLVRLSPCSIRAVVGLGSDLDPPGRMELGGLRGPARAWPAVAGSVAHPAGHSGGVGRAVVKIYHGRHNDRRRHMWRITQEEPDKAHRCGPYPAAAVT
jgi:hypothetical protein